MQSHINDYITDGESPVSYPYLDTKGCLTIGKGFKSIARISSPGSTLR